MSKRKFAVFGLALTVALLHTAFSTDSPRGTVKGRVVDAFEHAPIGGAYVLLHGSEDIVTHTDGEGRYSSTVKPGIFDVFVSSGGFSPACRGFRAEAGQTVVYDVTMNVNNDVLEQ
jgi:hypothetical protein